MVVVGVGACLCVDCKLFVIDLFGTQCQLGSLAGAAHLPVDNGSVLPCAECVQQSPVDQNGTSLPVFYIVNMIANRESIRDVVLPQDGNTMNLLTLRINLSSCSCVEGQHGDRVAVLRTTPHHTRHSSWLCTRNSCFFFFFFFFFCFVFGKLCPCRASGFVWARSVETPLWRSQHLRSLVFFLTPLYE